MTLFGTFAPSPSAPIVGLFFSCRPSAITRLVVSVIVDSVQGHPGWPRPHMVKKLQGVFAPFRRHPNAPSAVVRVRSVSGAMASPNSSVERLYFGRDSSSCRAPVTKASLRALLAHDASATCCVTRAKIAAVNCRLVSAVARAYPLNAPSPRKESQRDQASNSFSSYVYKGWHQIRPCESR